MKLKKMKPPGEKNRGPPKQNMFKCMKPLQDEKRTVLKMPAGDAIKLLDGILEDEAFRDELEAVLNLMELEIPPLENLLRIVSSHTRPYRADLHDFLSKALLFCATDELVKAETTPPVVVDLTSYDLVYPANRFEKYEKLKKLAILLKDEWGNRL